MAELTFEETRLAAELPAAPAAEVREATAEEPPAMMDEAWAAAGRATLGRLQHPAPYTAMQLRVGFLAIGLALLCRGVEAKEAKENKPKKEYLCTTCQSVAHLLVKLRKSDKSGNTTSEVVKEIIKEKDTKVCTDDLMKFYADRLEPKLDAAKMAKKCKEIVPDNPNFKSASEVLHAMVAKKPRSDITKILCLDSGRCDKLWDKQEEPWQKKGEEL